MAHLKMSKIVTRSLLSKPPTRLYPFEKREPYAGTRGHVSIDINACTFCTLCQKKCPTHAITVDRAGKNWSIDRMKCIQCSACVDACPKKCLSMAQSYTAPSLTKGIESLHQETAKENE